MSHAHALRELLAARAAGGPVTAREAAVEAQLRRSLAATVGSRRPGSLISKPALARMKKMHLEVMRAKQSPPTQSPAQPRAPPSTPASNIAPAPTPSSAAPLAFPKAKTPSKDSKKKG